MSESPTDAPQKRRRRRRRRGGGNRNGGGGGNNSGGSRRESRESRTAAPAEPVIVATRGGRRQVMEVTGGPVSVPASGRNPHRKRSSRPRRSKPKSVGSRRRRLNRSQVEELQGWLAELPKALLSSLYKGLGGQPGRVSEKDRMIELASRAIAQGHRLGTIVRQLHEKDRKVLATLVQCGGLGHSAEFLEEMSLTYGGSEREWKRILGQLADKGLVMASPPQDGEFFYIVPEPILDELAEELASEMALPGFESDDVQVREQRPFSPPLDFSVTSVATYFGQRTVRFTQRQEIYRHDREEMDEFFSQLWEPNSDLAKFHVDFLMMHGMVELIGEFLSLNADVVEEWLQLEPEDQRDLVFRAVDRTFDMGEWVLWAIESASSEWVAERPLSATYRRWKRGRNWADRLRSGVYKRARGKERDSFTFAPLVRIGLLEMGTWGQEKFYRLSPRAQALLHPPEDDGFRQFYLTPSFEMMAPAGLAPILLFRMGELSELTACDRANTYRITEASIERALERGWRRDDVLQFLRDNSQLGLPENVEQTLKGWIGHRGDVEFHDVTLLTVHRSQIRRIESMKRIKPFLLHRFAPGMYAVDRSRKDELASLLESSGFNPSKETRAYPGAPEAVEARQGLHKLLAEAREASTDPARRAGEAIAPNDLRAVPGTRLSNRKSTKVDEPPKVGLAEVRQMIDLAMLKDGLLDMVYVARSGQRVKCLVVPQRLAFKGEAPVLVGLDKITEERRTFVLGQIERMRLKET